jgi:hypothetical protein
MDTIFSLSVCLIAAALLAMSLCAGTAWAYRPFDGTDAAVAEPAEVEIELGPAQYFREGPERTLVAPAAILNVGLGSRWEAVLEGQYAHSLSDEAPRSSLIENGAFLKNVLREGSLQDKPGPSLATEFGALLPGIGSEHGTGASIGAIVSEQWPRLTVHLNVVAALTRDHHGDIFIGAIFEGTLGWPVRPVAEVFYERDSTGLETVSGLAGAIWQWDRSLSFDLGVRRARSGDRDVDEVRAGLTWVFAL